MSDGSESRNVIVVGGKAGSKVVYDILRMGPHEPIGFIHNFIDSDSDIFGLPDFGGFDEPENRERLRRDDTDYFVATGDNTVRKEVTEQCIDIAGKPPINAVHPMATVSNEATCGTGNLINAGAVVNADTTIGDGAIINTGSVVEHDNRVDDYAQIGSGATLAGYVAVEPYAFVGVGANIIPHITVGERSTVAAGATVIEDVERGTTVAGVPAEKT